MKDESKILKRRAFTNVGLICALVAGIGVSALLIFQDNNSVPIWSDWLGANHWFLTSVRVGIYIGAIATFYFGRSLLHRQKNRTTESDEHERVKTCALQLLLWFAMIELLFGQALLPRILGFFFA